MGNEMIAGRCPHCQKAFTAAREFVGKRRAKCKKCGQTFVIASPSPVPAPPPTEAGPPPPPSPSVVPVTPETKNAPTLPKAFPDTTEETPSAPVSSFGINPVMAGTQAKPNRLKSIVKHIDDDVRSAKSFVQAKLEAKRLSQERKSAEEELNAAYREIGIKAETIGLGPDLPAFNGVLASRKKLTDAEAVLAQRRDAIKQAQEALQAETDKHTHILAALETEHRRLSEISVKAKSDLDSLKGQADKIDGDIQRLQTALNATPQAEPIETIKQRLANCQRDRIAIAPRLAPSQGAFDSASTAARSKEDEVNSARQSWRQAKSQCEAALKSANAAGAQTARDENEARTSLNTSLHAFGTTIFDAGMGADQLVAEFQHVKATQERISEIDRRSSGLQIKAAAASGKARRVAFWVAGLALLCLCLFLWGGKGFIVCAFVLLLSYIIIRVIKADRFNGLWVKLGLARPVSHASRLSSASEDGQNKSRMKRCVSCDTENGDDAQFCENCGRQLEASPVPENTPDHDGRDGKPVETPPKTMHGFTKHAFISHSSRDHELAKRVCEVLEGHGVICWIAPRDIDPGAPYDEEILRGIGCSQTFILLLSDAANESPHVKRELMVAIRAGHAVYPIRIQEVQPGPKLEYLLEGIHWVDAWTPPIEAHLDRLARLIVNDPNVDKHRGAGGRKLTGGPLWKTRRRSRLVFAGIFLVLALLIAGWAASTWKEGVISGIVAYMTQQVDARLKGKPTPLSTSSATPSAPSAQTTEEAKNITVGDTIRKKGTKVNQIVTLSWSHDPNAEKRYPASEQILDDAGNVIGEVSLEPSDLELDKSANIKYYHTINFSFRKGKGKGKETTVICIFREDAAVGQTKIGEAGGLFFSGRVMEIKRSNSSYAISNNVVGSIDTVAIQVVANSSPQIAYERAAVVGSKDGERKKVDQTITLSWVLDPKVVKHYPSGEQILDAAGDVIGEVSINPSDAKSAGIVYYLTVTLSFKKGKEETTICVFRPDDAVGQTRVGKADDISFSSRVQEIKRICGSQLGDLNGSFESLTIQLTAKR
jgi:hypothetical protein